MDSLQKWNANVFKTQKRYLTSLIKYKCQLKQHWNITFTYQCDKKSEFGNTDAKVICTQALSYTVVEV